MILGPPRPAVAFALPFLLLASPVRAGSGAGERWQVDLRGGWVPPAVEECYRSAYRPTLLNHPESGGEATQSLALEGGSGAGFGVAVGYALTPRLGLQAIVGGHRVPLAVSSGPHEVRLHYQGRQPPDYAPRDFEVAYSADWPGGDGELRQRHLALNLAVRAHAGERLSFGVSGGPVVHRLEGELDSLGYQSFREGGHGVLFSELHRVRARIEPAWGVGLNLGADAALRLGRRWSLLLDARWFHLPGVDAGVRVDRLLNADELVSPRSLGEISAGLDPGPIGLAASFVALTAGVRLHF